MTTSPLHTHLDRRDLSVMTAGIPYMIGFPPTNSLVLFTFTRGAALGIATTMRADLPQPEHVDGLVDHLVKAAKLNEAVAVLAVLVGGGTEEAQRPLVDTLRKRLEDNDILLVHASWVRAIADGERWQCYVDPLCTDELPDPQTSTWAAAMAIAGNPLYRDREEAAAHLAPDPPETLARREELLDKHLRNPQHPYTEADLDADLSLVTNTLANAEASLELPVLTDRQVVRLARALSHQEVKDECMAAALSETPEAAERLWTVLIRALPAPERADPAVLLAMSAYLRGAGVLAAMAVRTALEANPAHETAYLLDAALSQAVPPDHLRTLLFRSILRNEGLPDELPADEPRWDPAPDKPPERLTPDHPTPGSAIPGPATGALNERTATTLGLLSPPRPMTLDPLTAFLPAWPGGDGT